MAKNETRRLTPSVIQADLEALAALEKIEGYSPYKKELTVENLKRMRDEMFTEQNAETQSWTSYQSHRDNACAREWELHNGILDSKTTVAAIFGKSSNEVQSMGLKKKTEYKTGSGRPKK